MTQADDFATEVWAITRDWEALMSGGWAASDKLFDVRIQSRGHGVCWPEIN